MDPVTPSSIFTDAFTDGAGEVTTVLPVAIGAIVGVGAVFWAARLGLRKLGFGGKVTKI